MRADQYLVVVSDAATSGSLIIYGTGEVSKPANEAGGPDTVTTTLDFEALISAGSFRLQLFDFELVDLGAGLEWVDFDTGLQALTKGTIISP